MQAPGGPLPAVPCRRQTALQAVARSLRTGAGPIREARRTGRVPPRKDLRTPELPCRAVPAPPFPGRLPSWSCGGRGVPGPEGGLLETPRAEGRLAVASLPYQMQTMFPVQPELQELKLTSRPARLCCQGPAWQERQGPARQELQGPAWQILQGMDRSAGTDRLCQEWP
jgi:hypothetical protein